MRAKRKKRDKAQRAYMQGKVAGTRGHSHSDCPYHQTKLKAQWLAGWREGKEFYRAGYIHAA